MPISRIISSTRSTGIPSRNPYRTILRRDYPEPFIALLAFILGIWLWDHYFGQPAGYAPGTAETALLKIDRDLRLADAMSADPAWLRGLAGVDTPRSARADAITVFQKLAADNSLSLRGLEAFSVVKSRQDQLPLRDVLAATMQGRMIFNFASASADLAEHRGTWWQAHMVENWEQRMRPATHWHRTFAEDSQTLRSRAIFARGSVWLLGIIGLAFLPGALRILSKSLHAKIHGYGGAWPLPLGLVVFLAATLAWIGFTMTLEVGITILPGMHPAAAILLDSAARLLPPLIALGLLFRRPSHAARVLGLTRPIPLRPILGLFALLMLLDQLLRLAFGNAGATDPGGGLNTGDAGLWGLAFAIISACLLAPLAEELLYRGVLFRSFWNRLGVFPAAVLSSIVFAILHFYDGYGLASVGIFGFTCALFYAGTGSLAAAISLHMLYNLSIKVPEWIVYHAPLG